MKRIKILFIALAHSSHTQSWIEMLDDSDLDVMVYGVKGIKYEGIATNVNYPNYYKIIRSLVIYRVLNKFKQKVFKSSGLNIFSDDHYLLKVIYKFKPNVIHTLGFDPSGYMISKLFHLINKKMNFKWIHTSRGGPELALEGQYQRREEVKNVLKNCDLFIADNYENYNIACRLGLESEKCFHRFIPGTGGVDVNLYKKRKVEVSKSRIILFPKAYECPASKAQPVLEAIKLSWEKIKPCKIIFTATSPEIILWINTLPDELQASIIVKGRIPRSELLQLLLEARLVLGPSLIDGIPNLLYEAMACGAVPVFSPILTIKDIFESEKNIIYARNLYPYEISNAIVRGMTDNTLCENIYKNNIKLVAKIADKKEIREIITSQYYECVKKKVCEISSL